MAASAPTNSATASSVPGPDVDDDRVAATDLDVQGHRGARGLRPENTLPGFEVALDWGVTTVELDLHFTADDQVVVWHDPMVDAAKCGVGDASVGVPDPDDPLVAEGDLMIRNLTAAQVRTYRCDRNPDVQRFSDQPAAATTVAGADYGIVTLGELFEFVATYAGSSDKTDEQRSNAANVRFNVETKRRVDEPETIGDGFDGSEVGPFEVELLAVVAAAGVAERTTIQSFDHRSLWAVHDVDPSLSLAALTLSGTVDHEDLAVRGATVWSPNQNLVDAASLTEAHDAGLQVIPWTVNEPGAMERLIRLGVDGLITDRPDLLIGLIAAE